MTSRTRAEVNRRSVIYGGGTRRPWRLWSSVLAVRCLPSVLAVRSSSSDLVVWHSGPRASSLAVLRSYCRPSPAIGHSRLKHPLRHSFSHLVSSRWPLPPDHFPPWCRRPAEPDTYTLRALRANAAFWLLFLLALVWCYFNAFDDPSSVFYDPDRAYLLRYSAVRAAEVDRYLQQSAVVAPEPRPRPLLCVGIPTVNRTTESFLEHAVGSLVDSLTPAERELVFVVVLLADRDPATRPAYGQDWLGRLADEVLVYGNSSSLAAAGDGDDGGGCNVDNYRAVPYDVRDVARGDGRTENMSLDHSVLVERCRAREVPETPPAAAPIKTQAPSVAPVHAETAAAPGPAATAAQPPAKAAAPAQAPAPDPAAAPERAAAPAAARAKTRSSRGAARAVAPRASNNAAVAAANKVLGKRLSAPDDNARVWNAVSDPNAKGTPRDIFTAQVRRFWAAIRGDPAAQQIFINAGAVFPPDPCAAPFFTFTGRGVRGTTSIDHIEALKNGGSPTDPNNLRFLVSGDNANIENINKHDLRIQRQTGTRGWAEDTPLQEVDS